MLSIIPYPKKVKENKGRFLICDNQKIKSAFDLPLISEHLTQNSSNIEIFCDDEISKEGYNLIVTPNDVKIFASTQIGAYYALTTLRKISKYDLGSRVVPCCEISDEPKFAWRGLQLDESRHFFGVENVKKLIDLMFLEKLNVFHWHLTDDTGWRIEIKQYPLLTEIGSKRKYSQINGWKNDEIENKEYGGFYTQEEIKNVINYAKERGIEIVPEIDFPAHCASLLAAYKDVACREIETEVPGYFGGFIPEKVHNNKDWNRTLCVSKDKTYEMIFNILDEVCELFESNYLHVGGDEAPLSEWKKCPSCQKLMKDEGHKNERELQGYFENKILEYARSKNKKIIGWYEILKAKNIEKNCDDVVVQYWTPQRDKRAEDFVNNGGKMIMSNHKSFYFDMTYAQYPLKNTYNYSPSDFGVDENNISNVLGVEGELWTEWIRDMAKLEMNLVPRLQALSEVAWSDSKNYKDFLARLEMFKPVLNVLGVNWARDEISMPKNLLKRKKIVSSFFKNNTYLEVELNEKLK